MRAQTEILFFRWVTLTEQEWVSFRERRSFMLSIRPPFPPRSGRVLDREHQALRRAIPVISFCLACCISMAASVSD